MVLMLRVNIGKPRAPRLSSAANSCVVATFSVETENTRPWMNRLAARSQTGCAGQG